MVKTRHSGDPDDLVEGGYLSLPPRRSARTQHSQNALNGYAEEDEADQEDSEESGTITYKQFSARETRRKRLALPIEESTGTDDEDLPVAPAETTRRSRRGSSQSSRAPESAAYSSGRSTRARDRQLNREFAAAFDGEDLHGLRRTSRQRKLLYDNLNDTIMDKNIQAIIAASEEKEMGVLPRRSSRKRLRVEEQPQNEEGLDMYSRVKRERRPVIHYGSQLEEDRRTGTEEQEEEEEEEDEDSDDGTESTSSSSDSEEEQRDQGRSYFLREHKPRTQIYEAPAIEPKKAKVHSLFRAVTPPRRKKVTHQAHRSPARKNNFFRRKKRTAFHGSSSTSSSGDSSSDDEATFERRKAKSMARARQRCLPMNFSNEDLAKGILRDRAKIGSSLADIDPMNIDRTITFDSVGGLGKHVRALKEMVVFPLLYPEVFERFKIQPPRGVLFYGPPGTGKTLVARALANECSHGDRKVAFYMRKGADCLSKWVGESERQLRLLFDQAYQTRPSIIFFDEIDGLAPVRSSRQDQIHSSIVSTLLALMDGLDNRGEVVIIGATNRIDSIDPALRRPGRFDREFLFPLPSAQARKRILQIHTKEWKPKLSDAFLAEVAERCVGYCGADLKALCAEAALHALRRRYPQIYTTQDKLELDVSSIDLSAKDFHRATQAIVPTTQRSMSSPGRSLAHHIKPLLCKALKEILALLQVVFPDSLTQLSSVDVAGSNGDMGSGNSLSEDGLYSDDDETTASIFETARYGRRRPTEELDLAVAPFMKFASNAYHRPSTHRPRLLVAGCVGQGQTSHLGPAVLHHLEKLPVHVLDLPGLYGSCAKTPEESCVQVFREARRTSPSIVYLPCIEQWWDVAHDALKATFLSLLQAVESSTPLLLLATSDIPPTFLPEQVKSLFSDSAREVVEMVNPTREERHQFFEDLLLHQAIKPPATQRKAAERILEVLPKAKPAEPRKLTDVELKRLRAQEEATLRELRLFLRDVVSKLGRDRKFSIFTKPVDEEEVPDYYQIIENPMDLASMMSKIDLHKYGTVAEFMDDIDLICHNALEYNPASNPQGRAIRHRACALRDTANAVITAELDADFEKLCEEIKEARRLRNEDSSTTVPKYYHTKPPERMAQFLNTGTAIPPSHPCRFSRRQRGMSANNKDGSQPADGNNDTSPPKPRYRTVVKRVCIPRSSTKSHVSPWCRPTKRRTKKVVFYIDSNGNEYPASQVEFDEQGNLKVKEQTEEKEEHTEEDEEEEEDDGQKEMSEKPDADMVVHHGPDPTKYRTVVRKVVLARRSKAGMSPWCKPTKRRYRNVVFYVDSQGHEYSADSVIVDEHGNLKSKEPNEAVSPSGQQNTGHTDGEESMKGGMEREAKGARSPVAGERLSIRTSPRVSRRGTSPASAGKEQGKPTCPPSSPPCSPKMDQSPSLSPRLSRSRQSSHSETEAKRDDSKSKDQDQREYNQVADSEAPGQFRTSYQDQRTHKQKEADSSIDSTSPKGEVHGLSEVIAGVGKDFSAGKEGNVQDGADTVSMETDQDKDVGDGNNNEEDEEGATSPRRVTRSQRNTPQARRALEELQRPTQNVVVDQEKLCNLLDFVVSVTEGFNVEKLEKVYSVLSQCVYQHRQDYNKEHLVQDMDQAVKRFARG